MNLTPCQFLYIAFAKTCKARKEKGTFKAWILTGCSCKCLDFFQCQVVTLYLSCLKALDATQGVDGNNALVECLVDASTELVEVRNLGVL